MNADALIDAVLILMFLVWFYGPWQDICTDYARQIVFEQRDKLFDLAANGEISFNSKDYIAIRSSLNSTIRFAHDATLPRIIYIYFVSSREFDYENSSFFKAMESLKNKQIFKDVEPIIAKSMIATAWLVIMKSLPCMMLLLMLFPLVIILGVCMAFIKTLKECVASLLKAIGGIIQTEADFGADIMC